MAERRMFTKKITESDAFLEMPMSAQCLYFHLNMSADDDGFVNNPKRIQRLVGASDDDMKLLIAKSFIIIFESGIIVIKHWKMHNYIQTDRYRPTDYTDEKSLLYLKKNKAYTLDENEMYTKCIQNVSIGKDRLGKDRLGKDRLGKGDIQGGKEKTKPKVDFEKMVDEKLFPEAISEKVKEWLKYKTEIKKPYNTEVGFNTFLKKVRTNLTRYGENAVIEVIDDSMSNGYQGVIWDRLEKTKAYHKQTKADELNDFYAMAADWAEKED